MESDRGRGNRFRGRGGRGPYRGKGDRGNRQNHHQRDETPYVGDAPFYYGRTNTSQSNDSNPNFPYPNPNFPYPNPNFHNQNQYSPNPNFSNQHFVNPDDHGKGAKRKENNITAQQHPFPAHPTNFPPHQNQTQFNQVPQRDLHPFNQRHPGNPMMSNQFQGPHGPYNPYHSQGLPSPQNFQGSPNMYNNQVPPNHNGSQEAHFRRGEFPNNISGAQRPLDYNPHRGNPNLPPGYPFIHEQVPEGVNPRHRMPSESSWSSETNLHRGLSMESLHSVKSVNLNTQHQSPKKANRTRRNKQNKNKVQNNLMGSSNPFNVGLNKDEETRPLSRNSSYSNDASENAENLDINFGVNANKKAQHNRGRGRGRGTGGRGHDNFGPRTSRGRDQRPLSRSSSYSNEPDDDLNNLNSPFSPGNNLKVENTNFRRRGKGRGGKGPGRQQNEGVESILLSRNSSCSNDQLSNLDFQELDAFPNAGDGKKQSEHVPNSSRGRGKQQGRDGNKRKSKENRKNHTQNKPHQQKSSVTVEQLEKLKQYDTLQIINILSTEESEYSSILQEDHESKVFILVVDILSKICESPPSQLRAEILRQASLPVFTSQLFSYVTEFPYLEDDMLQCANQFFENAISLYEALSDFMPSATRMWHNHILEVQKSLNVMSKNPKIELNRNLLNMAKYLLDEVGQNLKKDVKEEKVQNQEKKKETYFPEPVGNFRTVSLYPRPEDIYAEQPFLYPNVINGPYRSVEHYLDIHFKLLREDFMSPIRQAMRDYKKQCNTKDRFKRVDNVRIYRKVKFLHPKTVFDTVGYEVCFDVDNKINRVNWEFSNRFMFGSLLLFTDDNFDSFFMATVANRNVKELEKKLVTVELVEQVDNVKSILGKEFIMAESEAYFNPYFQVLKALQRFDETNFPLAKYIVHVNTETQPPIYLHLGVIYSIRMAEGMFTFRVLSDMEWPTHEQLGLDISQYGAFKAALTNDLTVIQGPPGTGKTFLGLKIAQALLANAHIWNQTNTPIFVVCFTNHALDQFLEGLLPVTTKLVRIGGKSKGSELDKFNIRERRREYSYYKKVQGREIRELKLKMSTVFADIQVHQSNLKALENTVGVVSIKTLQLVMSEEQRNYFSGDDDFMDWLLAGVARAKTQEKVKITITADRGVVREAPAVNPLTADEDDWRVKQAFFDTIDLDTDVGPSEDTVTVQFACDMASVSKRLEDLKKQLNGKKKFQLLENKKKCEDLDLLLTHLRKELIESKKYPRSDLEKENLLQENYLRRLKPDERWRLYHTWVNILRDGLIVELGNKDAQYKEFAFRYEQLRQNDDLQILKTAHVVGTTTTLAAKFQPMFEALAPRIVIVEEAAEVLEAHIIASLSRSCNHLILIGDHKQLRPTVAETRMARQYQLDVSLFERLVMNNMACHTLTLQHRMRPEISCQLVPTIYPQLRDDTSVLDRDDIRGMDKNVFFMTHNNFEDEVIEITSKRNRFEAEILLGLAKYLVQQGYKPQDITILATYKGQMYHMKNEIKNMAGFPRGIQITVVDNFQGEENKIILLSLVRSNAVNKIGFLEIENRICVALSRARDGMYMVGNMNCLVASSPIWAKIRTSLMQQQAYGPALNLRCQIHRDQVTSITSAKDFSKVSEGGCSLLCGQPLPCGHSCKSMCHVEQDYHQRYKCKDPCYKILCAEGHQCPKKCHQPCGQCQIPMRRQLGCGHYANVPCHMDVRVYACLEMVRAVVPSCRHEVTVPCHTRLDPECNLPCTKRLECGHSCEQPCHVADDPDHLEYACMKPCARLNKNCSMDHKCNMACFEECKPCPEKAIRELPCGHSLKLLCSVDLNTVVCQQKCKRTMACGHPCTKKCFQECEPCLVPMKKKVPGCGHTIEVACSVRATRDICDGPCPDMLDCGHQCGLRCQDPCSPAKCVELVRVKKKKPKTAAFMDMLGRLVSQPKPKQLYPLLCGHMEAHVPCNKLDQVETMKPEELMEYCSEPCGMELTCKHICSGTCSECMQGRIHKLCNEQCGNVLICGHSCKVPCREVCPPCKEPCRHECKHSKCSRKCGEECVPCKEPCDYACPHLQCSRRCGELCDREPCYEPCPERFGCGHPCVGYCGEPCPPCRQCEPQHFEEIFFTGEETEEDAKWVLLVDCGHTVESTGVEMWLNMEQESGEIGCKVCPRCKTPIVKVQRFMNLIKQTYLDIQRVKAQCFGKRDDICKERAQALEKIQSVTFRPMHSGTEPDELENLYNELKVELPEVKGKLRNTIDSQRLRLLCFWTEFFISVYKRKEEVWSTLDYSSQCKLNAKINFLTRLLMKRKQKISEQEMESFEREVKRIHRMADLFMYSSSPEFRMAASYSGAIETRTVAESCIFSLNVYDEELDSKIKALLVKLKVQIKSSATLSDAEKAMINKAMSSSFNSAQKTGHWFKCKNGHLYCITECGGAMQEARCPYRGCGEMIGGRQHRLRDDQTLASEMDGARHAAWSDANNMANYGFRFN